MRECQNEMEIVSRVYAFIRSDIDVPFKEIGIVWLCGDRTEICPLQIHKVASETLHCDFSSALV